MYDALVVQRLAENNEMYNSALKAKLDEMMSRERVLDKAPDKYVPVCRGMEFEPFGAYSIFRSVYAQYDEREGSDYRLNIDDEIVVCDKKSYTVLRTLMDVGVTKSMARAMACRDLFVNIIACRHDGMLMCKDVATVLIPTDDYYKNEMIRACLDCMFTDEEQVVIKFKGMVGEDYKDGLLEKLGSPSDVDELEEAIKRAYKVVCKDQTFRVKKNLGRAINVARYINAGYAV